MSRPSPESARVQRNSLIESRLGTIPPIWSGHNVLLYRSRDGFYLICYLDSGRKTYLIVTADGLVRDLSGACDADGADVYVATVCFGGAGLPQMRERVITW